MSNTRLKTVLFTRMVTVEQWCELDLPIDIVVDRLGPLEIDELIEGEGGSWQPLDSCFNAVGEYSVSETYPEPDGMDYSYPDYGDISDDGDA